MVRDYDLKKAIAWSLYDWANSAFATTVMAGFFPVFFKQYWSAGADATVSSFKLGLANSLSSLVIVALSPLLGAIADRGSAKKKFLLFFSAIGIVMTGALYLVARGEWAVAILLYVLATLGFSGGSTFYDALLLSVTGEHKVDFVSALGFAMGYLGGGLLFALNVTMTLTPQTFGLPDATAAVRLSFVTVALWWALFSIPIFLFVDEPRTPGAVSGWRAVRAGLRQVAVTFGKIRRLRVVLLFLIGYWLYIDGVDTIVRMAVDYGMALGFDAEGLILALLIVQFVGFPAAIVFGWLGERIGPKVGILVGIGAYVAISIWGFFLSQVYEFYILAVGIGLVQGGVQSLSRSFYTRLIPKDKAAEFFGFYNMWGRFAAVIGPVLMGWTGMVTGNPRYSILAIIVLFVGGAAFLYFVDEAEGRRMAGQLEADTR
jgi:UMF1 family MFS transporter